MIETKCIEVDKAQQESDRELNNEQWQALVALHRTLLHEHHDFFLASQHPSARLPLRRLAAKYAMPARMWRHGIHSFLELMRHRLPHSLEHMLTFLYLAYIMLALLYETVPAFEETWIECLGDLGRYRRMAIEDDDFKDREMWTSISRCWYLRASHNAPNIGRLYHHLAILCRPNPIKQLLYYTKSLCAPIPYLSAQESIMTVPMFDGIPFPRRLSTLDATFLQAHAMLFAQRDYENFNGVMERFLRRLEDDQNQLKVRTYMTPRHPLALITCNSLLGYGNEKRILLRSEDETDSACDTEETIDKSEDVFDTTQLKQLDHACTLAERIDTILMLRVGDPDILEYLHVRLIFMLQIAHDPFAMSYLENWFPWGLAAMCLNAVAISVPSVETIQTDSFPRPSGNDNHVLCEDWQMRGLFWTEKYFPADWFANEVDFDSVVDGYKQPTPARYREERVLFVGRCLAESPAPLLFDPEMNLFTSTLEEPPAECGPIPRQAISPGITQSQNGQASTLQNTKVEVRMTSTDEIDETLLGLDTQEAAKSSVAQNTRLAQPGRGISQTIVEQSDVASVIPRTPSAGTSTGTTYETLLKAPQQVMNCMGTSENTEVTSTHQTEVNVINATTSKSHGTKIKTLTSIAYPEPSVRQGQTDCATVIPRKAEDIMDSHGKDSLQLPITEVQQAEQAATGPVKKTSTSRDISTTEVPLVKKPAPFGQSTSFPCAHCACIFRRACDLNKHASKHTKPVKCGITGCQKTCSTRRDLKRHQTAKHPERFDRERIPCDFPECGRFFARRDHMVRHKKAFHPS
ncbi:hypothetical protein EDB81DRAFT_728312 [Dactylonectria macrodidyma]|uniref:C2H2-type domain-containing protein n=1 Tax=Dactylonectria macrodidyma TaxID=307937 RepID=A0A9P9E5R7_9HYPO|nr:hypothetical protein EDB81DRAFT_728312 [Dactylonectria macrodidyma]